MEEKLSINDQGVLKGLCKALTIIFKVLRILIYVAIPCIILAMCIVPKMIKNLEYRDNVITLTYKGDVMKLVKKDDNVKTYYNNKSYGKTSDVYSFDLVKNMITKHSTSELIGIVESVLLISIAMIFITSELLRHLEKLFKNIRCESTPFTEKNLSILKSITNFLIILIVVPIISNIVFSIVVDESISLFVESKRKPLCLWQTNELSCM